MALGRVAIFEPEAAVYWISLIVFVVPPAICLRSSSVSSISGRFSVPAELWAGPFFFNPITICSAIAPSLCLSLENLLSNDDA
jgi:hypothetical protein